MARLKSIGVLAAAAAVLAGCASITGTGARPVATVEDFEGFAAGATPQSPWRLVTDHGQAVVDDARAASGRHSLRLEVEGKGGVLLALPIAPSRPSVSGRMKVWLEAAPRGDVHWTLIEARGRRASDGHTALARFGGQHPVAGGSRLMANYETPDGYSDPAAPMSDCWRHAAETEVMPEGRWVAVAWTIGPNGLSLSLDGRPVDGLTDAPLVGEGCVHGAGDQRWELPAIDELRLGWESYQPDGPRRLWIDDIRIDD